MSVCAHLGLLYNVLASAPMSGFKILLPLLPSHVTQGWFFNLLQFWFLNWNICVSLRYYKAKMR